MMLVLKIPIAYLAFVVWYAIKSEPEQGVDPHDYSVWRPWRRSGGPHGTRSGRAATRAARGRVRT